VIGIVEQLRFVVGVIVIRALLFAAVTPIRRTY